MREKLYSARKRAGLTQGQVAAMADIDRTIYNKIERGKIKSVRVDLALRLAEIVRGSVSEIFLVTDSQEMHMDPTVKAG
ncbi:helix-turn-helix domain protein [Peptococcaceae bacterium CEB3]|nr:helix-turn-helix domain protein [Peptococcaceae bacterium CEB3]